MSKTILIFKSILDPDGKKSNEQVFVEAHDENGKSIDIGEWAADGEYETLTIDDSKPMSDLRKVTEIAKDPGNAMANDYLRGMANGLILALHIMDNVPAHIDPPYINPDGTEHKRKDD